jgi:circadian clock protein KaiC
MDDLSRSDTTIPAVDSDRVASGIAGLDDILGGGLPRRRLYLIEGDPGTGKTTLALQFLQEGRRQGESVLYITLSETKDELTDVARSHGWSLEGIALYEIDDLQRGEDHEGEEYTVFHPAEVELSQTSQRIYSQVESLNPSRVVFDSLSEFRLMAQGALRYRREILRIKQFFARRQSTVLLLDDRTSEENDLQLQSISHGVIRLERIDSEYGVSRRRLQVLKMRGVCFREGFHDYTIRTGGLAVFPRLVASEHRPPYQKERASSGITGLDALLGGGIERASSTLIIGPAGSGKSTLATQFIWAACKRGERVWWGIFEENCETFRDRASGLGMPVGDFIDSGLLQLQQIDPGAGSPGELVAAVRTAVERDGVRIVVIDSLNGYLNAIPNEQFLLVQMHELLTYLSQQGVITFLVMAQHGLVGPMQAPIEVSYLADNVVMLRYFEAQGEVRVALSIVKKRKGAHERTIRELWLTSDGIRIGEPLREFSGVLTGSPRFRGDKKDLSAAD